MEAERKNELDSVWLPEDLELTHPPIDLWTHPKLPDLNIPTSELPHRRAYVIGQGQGQCLAKFEDADVRMTISQIAAECAGMQDDGEEDASGYAIAIAPGEDPQMRHDMRKMSGCALLGRAIARFAGIYTGFLCPPYRIGAAFNDIYELGRVTGALKQGPLPIARHGCLMSMGRGRRTHMEVFMGLDTDGKSWAVAGGQVNAKGRQCVTWRERKPVLVKKDGSWAIRGLEDRELIWWFDFAAPGLRRLMKLDWRLPYRFESHVQQRPARP